MTKAEQEKAVIEFVRGMLTDYHIAAWQYSFTATRSGEQWNVTAANSAGRVIYANDIELWGDGTVASYAPFVMDRGETI